MVFPRGHQNRFQSYTMAIAIILRVHLSGAHLAVGLLIAILPGLPL